jgi:plastocyanin domain-containing protein
MRFVAAAVLALLLGACQKQGDPKVMVDEKGFHPSSLELKKGGSGRVVFTRTSDDTCAKEVVFKELGIKKDLPLGTPVAIDIPTDKERTLTFTCGMGMFESQLIVQ